MKLEIVAQAAEGLQAAHEAGVIHRDIKPGNILIAECGVRSAESPANHKSEFINHKLIAKLTDFGIGQVVSEEFLAGMTRAGFTQTMVGAGTSSQTGTQLYMAPELLAGKPASTRSDIYSLGVVLYQLLVGDFARPVTTDWAREITDPLLREDLGRCFAGNPQERFESAGQLATNLRSLETRRAEFDRQQTELAARERAAYRRGVLRTSAVAALVVITVVALAIFGFRQGRRAEIASRDLRRSLYVQDMKVAEVALQALNLGRVRSLLLKYLPETSGSPSDQDLRGWEWRYLWQQSRSDALVALCQKTNGIWTLAVSHDGRWVAVGENPSKNIGIWDLRSRQEIASLPAGEVYVRAAFSPREPLLAFSFVIDGGSTNPRVGVRLWNGVAREIVAKFALVGQCNGLLFSDDGQRLIIAEAAPGNQLSVWRVPDGTKIGSYEAAHRLNAGTPMAAVRDLSIAAHQTVGGGFRVVDLITGEQRWSVKSDDLRASRCLAFSPDAKVLASGYYDESEINLWDVASGKMIRRLEGAGIRVEALAFWPDGKTLASVGGDRSGGIGSGIGTGKTTKMM